MVHLALALLVFDPTVFTGGDNAAYLALARSMLQRHAYVSTWESLAPPHTQYPPVFPGMIAIALLLGVRSWIGIKLLVVICSTSAVALTYLWLRRRRRPLLALGVGLLVALSPGVLTQSHLELSDVPFWAFAMLALYAFERLGARDRVRFAIGVVAVVLGYFTRSAGLPLVLATLAWLAYRRRWRQLGILAAVIGPLAFLWWLRGYLQGGSEYVQLFWYVNPYVPALGRIGAADLAHRAYANQLSYLGGYLPGLLAGRSGLPIQALGVGVFVLAIYGWATRLRRPQLAEFFYPVYGGLLLVWPEVWAGERFLLPVYPLILAYAGEGGLRLLRRVGPRLVTIGALVVTPALALLAVPAIADSAGSAAICRAERSSGGEEPCLDPAWRDFFAVAGWSRTGLPANAAVFSRKPRLFYVYSGHPGHDIPTTSNALEFLATARQNRIGYILLDAVSQLTVMYVGPIVRGYPDAFCLVHGTEGGTALLRIVPGADTLFERPPRPEGEQPYVPTCAPAEPAAPASP